MKDLLAPLLTFILCLLPALALAGETERPNLAPARLTIARELLTTLGVPPQKP